MKVSEIMSGKIVIVRMDDTLRVVRGIFDNVKFHHLLVIENNKLLGVLSDRDLLKALSNKLETPAETQEDRATLNKRVHQIMNRNPITLAEDAMVSEAVELFNTKTISCIPIMDKNNQPVGIISWRDIIKLLANILPKKEKKQTPTTKGTCSWTS